MTNCSNGALGDKKRFFAATAKNSAISISGRNSAPPGFPGICPIVVMDFLENQPREINHRIKQMEDYDNFSGPPRHQRRLDPRSVVRRPPWKQFREVRRRNGPVHEEGVLPCVVLHETSAPARPGASPVRSRISKLGSMTRSCIFWVVLN